MIKLSTLLERRGKGRHSMILYHGTSSTFLRSILKQGLMTTPKSKVWDPDGSFSGPSLESYFGTYLTNETYVAKSSAKDASKKFGGNPLFVIVQVEFKSTVIDEDNVLGTYLDGVTDEMGGFKNYNDDIKHIEFFETIKSRNYGSKLKTKFEKEFKIDNFPLELAKEAVYTFFLREMTYTEKYKNLLSSSQGEKEFRRVMEKIMKFLRRLRDQETYRSLKTIAFSGKNKIIAIYEEIAPEIREKQPGLTISKPKIIKQAILINRYGTNKYMRELE